MQWRLGVTNKNSNLPFRRNWREKARGGKTGKIIVINRIVLRNSVMRFESLAPEACTFRGRTRKVPAVGERLVGGELFQVSKPPSIGVRTIICARDLVLFMYLITYAVGAYSVMESCTRARSGFRRFCDRSEKVEPREFGRVESGTGTGRESGAKDSIRYSRMGDERKDSGPPRKNKRTTRSFTSFWRKIRSGKLNDFVKNPA